MGIYDFTMNNDKGEPVSLADFKGKVLLIVNTATHCGFTPQYKELQELYAKYNERGFEILDFPCNQFANQAPEKDGEISDFCALRFGTKFPQFAKIDVNGANEAPLYTYLKSQKSGLLGSRIKWNFTKFLVDRDGNVIERFGSQVKPTDIAPKIEALL